VDKIQRGVADDLAYGKGTSETGRRGPLTIAPVFVLPPRPLAFWKFIPGYFLREPLFAAPQSPCALLPDVEVMKTLSAAGSPLFIVNCVAVFLFYSAFEYRSIWRGPKEIASSTTPIS
jgi:hypothetical protein